MLNLERAVIATARAAELESPNGGSGYTILKLRRTPIDALVSEGKIGALEFRAAGEFSSIFEDITRGLFPEESNFAMLETGCTSYGPPAPLPDLPPAWQEAEEEMWRVYKSFVNYWSARRVRNHNPLLSVFVSAVVDQQPLEHIAQDNGLTVKQAERMIIKGLRDYARRAGWR